MSSKGATHVGQGRVQTLRTIIWNKRVCIRQTTAATTFSRGPNLFKQHKERESSMDKVNAECGSDGASGKPHPWRGMPAPGVGLQALTSPVYAFSGLHDAPASPGADPTGYDRGRGAPDHADAHTATTWGLWQAPTRKRVPGRPERFPTACRGTATRVEAELEARHTWHNVLSLTVLHGSTPGPGDPQTIPTSVHSSVPCSCLQ